MRFVTYYKMLPSGVPVITEQKDLWDNMISLYTLTEGDAKMMYMTVWSYTLDGLGLEVNKKIEYGFEPIGSMVYQAEIPQYMTEPRQPHRYIQTVLKRSPKDV